jgi:hypothetical protein
LLKSSPSADAKSAGFERVASTSRCRRPLGRSPVSSAKRQKRSLSVFAG